MAQRISHFAASALISSHVWFVLNPCETLNNLEEGSRWSKSKQGIRSSPQSMQLVNRDRYISVCFRRSSRAESRLRCLASAVFAARHRAWYSLLHDLHPVRLPRGTCSSLCLGQICVSGSRPERLRYPRLRQETLRTHKHGPVSAQIGVYRTVRTLRCSRLAVLRCPVGVLDCSPDTELVSGVVLHCCSFLGG